LLFAFHVLINHFFSWWDGWLPLGSGEKLLFLFPLWMWGPLAIITYLDKASIQAIDDFSPLLSFSSQKKSSLITKFTHLPYKAVLFSGLFWTLIYVVQNYYGFESFYGANKVGPWGIALGIISGLPAYLFGSILAYYAFRLLRLVHSTLERVESFDLFNLGPVYAFSRLTALTGMSIILMLSLTLLIYPIELADPSVLSVLILQMLLAVAAFVLPLRSVNRKLSTIKGKSLADHQKRAGVMLNRLHQSIDEDKLKDAGRVEAALNSLHVEEKILRKVSTWPWRTETLREFISAIFLPMIIWGIQQLAARVF
jgi:hypothetical protein